MAEHEEEEEVKEIPPANLEQEHIVARMIELKQTAADAKEEFETLERLLDEQVPESILAYVGDRAFKVTPVRSSVTNVDFEAFHVAAPALYDQAVTIVEVPKLDSKVLTRALEAGDLSPADAAQFISIKPKKTSVRLTEVVEHGDEEKEN